MIDYKPPINEQFGAYIARLYPKECKDLKNSVKTVTFQVTENCCLKCTYCY
jgi:hypothetical protein